MKAGEEGKVICHNDRDGGGGGGGQTSAALKWTKVKEIIFVSTDDDAKLNRVSEDCEREREIEFCAHSEVKDERERARGRIESDFEAGQFAAEERSFRPSLFLSSSRGLGWDLILGWDSNLQRGRRMRSQLWRGWLCPLSFLGIPISDTKFRFNLSIDITT